MNAGAAPLCLDHVGFVARELAPLRHAMQRLGFAPTEPRPLLGLDAQTGLRVPLQQESCHIVLGSGYIELSAVLTHDPKHHLAPWLGNGPGLHILALGTADVSAQCTASAAVGLPVTAPARAARAIEYGSRHGEARFEWAMLNASATPEGLICWVRNLTPELVYQSEVMRHPNGAIALAELWIETPHPEAFSQKHESWLRALSPDGEAVRVLSRKQLHSMLGGTLPAVSATTRRFAALVVAVADRNAAAALLRSAAVPFHETEKGLAIPAAEACGAVLILR